MQKVIVYKNTDGSCSIIYPALKAGLTIEDVAAKDVPEGLSWRITTVDKLPQDRGYRNAWTDDNPTDTVDIDMEKARPLHMEKIREARDRKLKKLDVETMKGLDVQAQKQVLRDIPQTLDLTVAITPEDLKAIWPTELTGE